MRSMTLAIASYQRRDDVLRLVQGVNELATKSPSEWAGVDVVVVLDGSTDGSREALKELATSIPLLVIWQENSGLSAARNAGLEAATGEIIWYLDDDLLPLPGTIWRHRQIHEGRDNMMLLGPCNVAPGIDLYQAARDFWNEHNELRAQGDSIQQFDLIAVANASMPTRLIKSLGGFDERFVGYGLEDFELGLRLLQAGTRVQFDPEAVCWHYSEVNEKLERLRRRDTGANTVRFIEAHPEIAEHYFPKRYPSKSKRLLDRSRIRSPRMLAMVSHLTAVATPLATRLIGRGHLLHSLSLDASYAAGIADVDRSLLPKILGRPSQPRSG